MNNYVVGVLLENSDEIELIKVKTENTTLALKYALMQTFFKDVDEDMKKDVWNEIGDNEDSVISNSAYKFQAMLSSPLKI